MTSLKRLTESIFGKNDNGERWVPIDQVKISPIIDPRKYRSKEMIAERAESIDRLKQLKPVRTYEGNGFYWAIAGITTLEGCKVAGKDKVWIVVDKFDQKALTEIALIDNTAHNHLRAAEQARAIFQLQQLLGLTQEEAGRRCGINHRQQVSDMIAVAQMPDDLLDEADACNMKMAYLCQLKRMEDSARRWKVFRRIQKWGDKATVNRVKSIIDRIEGNGRKRRRNGKAQEKGHLKIDPIEGRCFSLMLRFDGTNIDELRQAKVKIEEALAGETDMQQATV